MNNNKLKMLRITKGLSQSELAKKAKVDRSYISQIETGKVSPSLAVLERIAKALGCNLKDFF